MSALVNKGDRLYVFWNHDQVGVLEQTHSQHYQFRYAQRWIAENRSPISQSLPLAEDAYGPEAENFFGNLLPEQYARVEMARQFKIDVSDDFGFLKYGGQDCAGALQILDQEHHPKVAFSKTSTVSKPAPVAIDIKDFNTSISPFQTILAGQKPKFSLAGAQSKMGIIYRDEKIYAAQGSPSTHILKMDHDDFPAVQNEVFCTALGRKIGLPCAKVKPLVIHGKVYSLHERYDRVMDAQETRRVHQEDFAQALGLSYTKKYEKDGGPKLQDLYQMMMKASTSRLRDKAKYLDWILFNFLIRNGDAHAKNLSLLYGDDGQCRLSPFYDLICTHVYQGQIDTDLALFIDGVKSFDKVHEKHLSNLAESLDTSPKYFMLRCHDMANEIKRSLPDVEQQFKFFLDKHRLKNQTVEVVKNIKKQVKSF